MSWESFFSKRNTVKRHRKHQEEALQMAVCRFIKLQFPDVIFSSEASGLNKGKAAAGKSKMLRSNAKLPDLWIPEPRGGHFGLFIEFKAKSPYLMDNTLTKDKHVQAQGAMLKRLRDKGYVAEFCWDLEETVAMIRRYMSQRPILL